MGAQLIIRPAYSVQTFYFSLVFVICIFMYAVTTTSLIPITILARLFSSSPTLPDALVESSQVPVRAVPGLVRAVLKGLQKHHCLLLGHILDLDLQGYEEEVANLGRYGEEVVDFVDYEQVVVYLGGYEEVVADLEDYEQELATVVTPVVAVGRRNCLVIVEKRFVVEMVKVAECIADYSIAVVAVVVVG